MKLIDREKGKIFGINFVDLIVLLGILVLIGFLTFRYVSYTIETFEFSGSDIYRAVSTYTILSTQGFLVKAEIKGVWTGERQPFSGGGLIVDAKSGQFVILLNHRKVTVGGPLSYVEDIAADRIFLKCQSKSVVQAKMKGQTVSSFEEIQNKIKNLADSFIEYSPNNILATFKVGIEISGMQSSPAVSQEVDNALYDQVFAKGMTVITRENGFEILFTHLSYNDLSSIDKILRQHNLYPQKIVTSSIDLYIGTEKLLSKNDANNIKLKIMGNPEIESSAIHVVLKPLGG
ncbi:MAG: hypothetical protein HY929_02015 [Euryarchaeota archaeon]|nr:hypothetical protein [Euryarchaeota archaeon]